jgi:hypothetical protein
VTAAGILQTEYTEAEAKAWAALLDVESYAVFLDPTADPGTIRSSSRIRFRCRERDAATLADLRAAVFGEATWTAATLARPSERNPAPLEPHQQ